MLGFPKPIDPDDERLHGHETVYSASRGGPRTSPSRVCRRSSRKADRLPHWELRAG